MRGNIKKCLLIEVSLIPANRINYILAYTGDSQLYATASKQIALETPPPPGSTLADKQIYFVTQHPDEGTIVWHAVPHAEVQAATIKEIKKKDSDDG